MIEKRQHLWWIRGDSNSIERVTFLKFLQVPKCFGKNWYFSRKSNFDRKGIFQPNWPSFGTILWPKLVVFVLKLTYFDQNKIISDETPFGFFRLFGCLSVLTFGWNCQFQKPFFRPKPFWLTSSISALLINKLMVGSVGMGHMKCCHHKKQKCHPFYTVTVTTISPQVLPKGYHTTKPSKISPFLHCYCDH